MGENKRVILFIVAVLILGLLVGCSRSKEVSSQQSYARYNEETELWELTEKAFKDAKLLDKDKIDHDTADELYIAMFGFEKYRSVTYGMSKQNTDDPRKNITFVDGDGNKYYIFDTNGKIAIRQQPALNDIYDQEIQQFGEEKFYLWEEFVSYYIEVYEGITDENYTISEYKIRKNRFGEESLFILFEEGICFEFNMNEFSFRYYSDDYFWNLAETTNNDESIDTSVHKSNYTKADLDKLPLFPQVSNDASNNLSLYYPQLDKKYVVLLDKDSKDNFKYYLDKFGIHQTHDFSYVQVKEEADKVIVTFYLEFWPVGNWDLVGFEHEYKWQNGEWILINEDLELYDLAGNLKLETGNKAQTKLDILSLLENKIWIYPVDNFLGATIEFVGNEMHQGYYMSEREVTDKYKVQQVKDNVVEMLINNKDKMTIKVINQGEKLEVNYKNDIHEFITESEWLRIKSH
ncbi:hypothetical protein CACET_c22630 [Clostridium aceticum]|uniref:Uncharacterized protein n=1 Tax=Clostridium aceticum TaxID=84022 RepID=A0A0D8I9L9_9CLOT|nr:hypothetical protein [Clostridium aceticum]AKL95709.1 hypothetical protein CACET_c22630 [Clostridium aceticum]KJF26737.1 hypothetical protein TZ02_10950 [Clostridium aceticum]